MPRTEPPEASIDSLAVRARAGERGCFDEIVVRLSPRLRSFVRGKGAGDADADDLVQETFTRALSRLDRYDESYKFSTWLFTIASNLTMSHHRKSRPQDRQVEAVATLASGEDAAAAAETKDAGNKLWLRAEDVLSRDQYLLLWLRYRQDLSLPEIADHTGKSAISVRVGLYRARRRLAKETL